jgi:hypothetical protein
MSVAGSSFPQAINATPNGRPEEEPFDGVHSPTLQQSDVRVLHRVFSVGLI